MNANKLSETDVMANTIKNLTQKVRQQQAEIEALKKEIQNQSLDNLMDWQQKLNTANTCKHGVDDGACKECYQEVTHPSKDLTDEEIRAEIYKHTYPVPPELVFDIVKGLLKKAQEK